MIIHGIYKWFPKRVAFRNDFCRSCNANTIALKIRHFVVLHFFWIPLIPLGFWSSWYCSRCRIAVHANTKTRKGFVVAILVLFILITLAMSFAFYEEPLLMVLWLLVPAGLTALLVAYVKTKKQPDFRGQLAAVKPYSGPQCPLCGGTLAIGPSTTCSTCGIEHLPLPER